MRKILLLCISICLSYTLIAQPPCGFDQIHQQLLKTDPAYKARIAADEAKMRTWISTHQQNLRPSGTNTVYEIPVVVHVLHTGGVVGSTYNPSDASITNAIASLNQMYAGTYPGMSTGGLTAGNTEIKFTLAKRTPTCGYTNGIDRVDASSIPEYTANGVERATTNGATDLTIKDFCRWDANDYYNIYIVNKIDGFDGTAGQFIAGYAYFAGASTSLDGTVMLATQIVIAGNSTLPHEIGHALNLYHTFEGSSLNTQCPANTTCSTQGDQVCDTDPVTNNVNGSGVYDFSCRTGANTCGGSYNIYTENNYMAYTNCFTLFTAGQKTRMQAAMSSVAGRISLVRAGNMALVPCGPSLNFSQASQTITESAAWTLTGCRKYQDYNYYMSVGEALTAAATATLTMSGTAVQGLDYDITTNGSFTSSSNVLSFASGATTSKTFTVRIYDNNKVDGARSAIINFNVSNGGGNAVKGTLYPTLTLSLADNDVAPVSAVSATSNFSYTTNIGGLSNGPFNGTKLKHRSQFLITKAEINAAGISSAASINKLILYITAKGSTKPFSGFTVSLMNYTGANLSNFVTGTFTQVYSGNYTTVVGNNEIPFSANFAWNGTDNIVVQTCFENATTDAANDDIGIFATLTTANYMNVYSNYSTGTTVPCSLPVVSASNYPYTAAFGYEISATQAETALSSTSSNHITVNSDEYVYSNNGKIMARLNGANANLGCVAQTIEASGTTWQTFLTGQRSAKVYNVIPTTNGATTSYNIGLYFANSELAGKNPANISIAKTSAASIGAANGTNTVIVTPTVTTLGSDITIFTGSFTGFSRFFLVENVTLPVTLLNLKAELKNNDALLSWQTQQEINNKGFEIQRSFDGITFAAIGFANGSSNSATVKNYSFNDVSIRAGVTIYYRLKQIDNDGNSRLTNTVTVKLDKKGVTTAFIYPNPAHGNINITFIKPVSAATTISIVNSKGQVLLTQIAARGSLTVPLNTSALAAGAYFVKMISAESTEQLQFIKQ